MNLVYKVCTFEEMSEIINNNRTHLLIGNSFNILNPYFIKYIENGVPKVGFTYIKDKNQNCLE